MMPEHANIVGTVHGGMIMRLCDEAGALCAMRHAQKNCVTVWMDSMTFESPVHVGEVLQLNASINYVGRTSMEVGVKVTAEDPIRGVVTHTNSAYLVFVALDADQRPTAVPGLIVEDDDGRRRYQEGEARHQRRLARKS
jgi:acyl-CoA hydrolase